LIKRHWATDRFELEKTFAAMKERKWPVCTHLLGTALIEGLTTFVEGTRLKPATLAGVCSHLVCIDGSLRNSRGIPVSQF
jgi:hypothetical protein